MNLRSTFCLVVALFVATVGSHAENSVVAWGGYWNGTKLFPGSSNVTAIAGSNIGLTSDGRALGWNKTVGPTNVWPVMTDGVQISAGRNHSMALRSSGKVLNSGFYSSISGGKIAAFVPATLSNVVSIASGCEHDLALKNDGTISTWGAGGYVTPAPPAGLSHVVAIAAGCGQNIALRDNGTVVAWGNPNLPSFPVPAGLNNVVAIAAKYYHFMALRRDGTVVAWGYNVYGESTVPTGLKDVAAIGIGEYHSLALKSDGTVVGWGHNNFGQTVAPTGATNIIALSGSFDVSLALMNDGSPVITVPPIGDSVTEGSTVSFSVLAVGAGGVNYQWRRNGDDVAGATSSAFSFTAQPTNAGNYSVRVSNNIGAVTSEDVLLTVTANHPPTATPANVDVTEDSSVAITLAGTDPDGEALTYSVVTAPANGTLTGTAPNVTYKPATNFNGADQLIFTVSDGKASSAPAAVQIAVAPANDAPVALPQTNSVSKNGSVTITLQGTDIDGDALRFSIGSGTQHGTLVAIAGTSSKEASIASVSQTIAPSLQVVTLYPVNFIYTPATNFVGTDQFTFRVSDGVVNSPYATVRINVLPVNGAPTPRMTISPLASITGASNLVVIAANGTNAQVVLNGKTSTDPENDPLSFAWLDGTNFLASTAITTNTLDVGIHEIELSVNDGGSTVALVTELEVISTDSSIEALIAFVKSTHLNPRNEQSLLASLYAAQASLAKDSIDNAISHMANFQSKVRAQISPLNPTLAQKFLRDSQSIIAALRRI